MRNLTYPSLFLAAVLLVSISACNTTQQRTAYNTIGALEATATASVDGYFKAVISGLASTNQVPTVAKAYNQFQVSATFAATVAQNGTNALAPSSLSAELGDLLNVISTAIPTKK